MLIATLIVPRAVIVMREAGSILSESTSNGLDLEDVRTNLLAVPTQGTCTTYTPRLSPLDCPF